MRVDYDIAMEIASHEAIVRQAYKDSVGVWTWSVGLTSATGHIVDRYIGKSQSLEHCLRVYVWALDNYADAVRKAFAGIPLTKAQFAAALSFHWNTGAIARASWVKKFKAGDIIGARKAFMDWRKPASIIGRREKERDLFFEGKWSNAGTMTEYTRVKANGTPDWSSARRINVEKELKAALAGEVPASDKIIVEQPVAVTPSALERPWWQSKEIIVPSLTGGALTGGATLMESFGKVPLPHLLVMIIVAFVVAGGWLFWSRHKEKAETEAKAKAVEARA